MSGPHDEHRKRHKARYMSSGLDGFEPHEIIELLLYYSIPRKDTNEIAHALIDKFGSVKGVIGAGTDELVKTYHITEHSAILMKLVWDLTKICALPDINNKMEYKNMDEVAEYLRGLYLNREIELVYGLAFDSKNRIKEQELLHIGDFNSASLKMRTITEFAIRSKCVYIILAHNHPNGSALPSSEDINSTKRIITSLNSNGITIKEHLILHESGYTPIIKLLNE